MRVLILGAKGMLGSDLMARLEVDHDVVGKDIGDFDLTDEESCRRVIDDTRPQVVINAAAYTDVDGAETERELCFAVNTRGVHNLCVTCREQQVRIVHISTDYVFDGTKGKLYTEDDIPRPINVYGASKRAGEEIIEREGGEYTIVRTAWLYGKNGKNFVTTIINKAKEEHFLRVVDDQRGSPTYTWDLAGAIKCLVEMGATGLFHVTNRGLCSWYTFARKIIEYVGIKEVTIEPITSACLNRKAPRPAFSGMSTSKFTEVTGKTLRFWPLALEDFLSRDLHLSH